MYRDIRKFFDREARFVKVRTRLHQMKESTRNEMNQLKTAVEQNIVNIFRPAPGLGR